MFAVFKKIYSLFNKQERRQFFWLLLTIIIVGINEIAGIASIMPFMAIVSNPAVVDKNQYLSWAYKYFGFSSVPNFLIALGFLVFFIILLSNCFKALALWLELRFVHFRLYSLSRRLLYSYLHQPYVFFLNQNSSNLGKNILQEVSLFAHHVLRPFTQTLSRLVIVFFILCLLFFVDPILAILILTTIGGAYTGLFFLIQRKLARMGETRFESNTQRSKAVSEVFGGIKELKVLGKEGFFFNLFSHRAHQLEGSYAKSNFISQLPSYIMEILSFGGILIIVLYFLIVRQELGKTLPVIALYAFAGYRLLPAMQGIFSAITLLRFNLTVLDLLHQDLSGIREIPVEWQKEKLPALRFREKIQLKSIRFSYPGTESPILKGLNLTIKKNSNIGFMGTTGSGKTTTIDLLLGLLLPQEGNLLVDDIPVTSNNLPQWQRNLGYVPQTIFLFDDSLAGNIALGVPPDEIDMAAVERASRIANLHAFVTTELMEGYGTIVGEHGVRLSGGQRQRIGIARALYHDPEILVMDEATSALDGITEEAVIQAIRNLGGKKTIIIIAHRLTTLKDCDLIYVMDKGQVVEKGTYLELSSSSDRFRAMANKDSVL